MQWKMYALMTNWGNSYKIQQKWTLKGQYLLINTWKIIEIHVDSFTYSNGNVVIGGIMEHIEKIGVHFGDLICSIMS